MDFWHDFISRVLIRVDEFLIKFVCFCIAFPCTTITIHRAKLVKCEKFSALSNSFGRINYGSRTIDFDSYCYDDHWDSANNDSKD